MKKTLVSAFCFIILILATVAFATPVPDTGQSKCYNDSVEITCPSPGQPFYGQDTQYTINPMSYTKLDGSGNTLPDSAASWVMVKDNVTGLIWEMKTNMDGVENYKDPHDADNRYTCSFPPGAPNIEDFIKALNDAHYGGYSDWRLPTIKELTYIVSYDIHDTGPAIDNGYFPNTVSSFYWSSTTDDTYVGLVNFSGGRFYSKSFDSYIRAVRGEQIQSAYMDNGNGTVTDTSTGLMWQKASSSNNTWEQALAYCEGLNLGGNTDWRLPTLKELRSLVDYNRYNPAINTTYFPNTSAVSWYWSSTTYAYDTTIAWGVYFHDGCVESYYKYNNHYVRAVRGGQPGALGNLVIFPAKRDVAKEADTTSFSVSNTGTGTMPWTAAVTPASSWLTIKSGTSGTNSATITCSYSANTTSSSQTATIRVTATGATGSPQDVTVTQASAPTACTATIDGNLSLHVPYITYPDPRVVSLWVDFVYEFSPTYPALILFKLINYAVINNPSFSCAASTLSGDLKIHIPDVLFPDGITHRSVDMEYSPALSTDVNTYFIVTKIE
jgi:hypothetical protein